jgi:sugar/nucleoside kinase (ribokinase family)
MPPSPCVPIDTSGVGNAYVATILYGILRRPSSLKGMGNLVTRVADSC